MDTQFLVTKSCDVKDALYLLHDLLDILFYIEPYIFLCLLFFFFFLVMVQFRTVHIVLGRDGNLESGALWQGWNYRGTLSVLGCLVFLWVGLRIGVLIYMVMMCLAILSILF